MNPEKLTQKTLGAINAAVTEATERANNAVEPIHLLYALLSDGEGLIPEIMKSSGKDAARMTKDAEAAVASLPKRERDIIELRYGLGGKREMTQKEVADAMGISQSYISRLEKRIILDLREKIS